MTASVPCETREGDLPPRGVLNWQWLKPQALVSSPGIKWLKSRTSASVLRLRQRVTTHSHVDVPFHQV